MDIKKLSPCLFVAGQISANDVGVAAAQGVKTIISNRPDNETADQPDAEDIAEAAADHSIDFVYVPVVSGTITDENVRDFTTACESAKEPILAFCRSGMRSTSLWALSEVSVQGIDAILSAARDVGYDLSDLRPRLEKHAVQPGTREKT